MCIRDRRNAGRAHIGTLTVEGAVAEVGFQVIDHVAGAAATLFLAQRHEGERGRRARNMVDDLEQNFGHCSLYGECADVCPAGVPLTAVSAVTRERARAAFRGKDD